MKVICAWCKKIMKEGDEPTSHGICPDCMKKMEKEFEEYQKQGGKYARESIGERKGSSS